MAKGEARRQRESRNSECIEFAEGQKYGQTFRSLIFSAYWKNVTQKNGIFPSQGRSLWGNGWCQMFSLCLVQGFGMFKCTNGAQICVHVAKEKTSTLQRLEVQWLWWFEWTHYIFGGGKPAKVYINKVLIRGKIPGVETLHKIEKKQSAGLKLKN